MTSRGTDWRLLLRLAFLLALTIGSIRTPAQEPPPKTLRDQVHEKGSATGGISSNFIVFGPYGFRNVVQESNVIVEGQVVSQDAHLTLDDLSVITDNRFVVYQVLKDTERHIKPKEQILVITPGGETTVDGGRINVYSSMKPLKMGDFYVLCLNRYAESEMFYVYREEFGAFRIAQRNGIVECPGGALPGTPCDKKISEFFQVLNEVLTKPVTVQ